MLEKFDLDFLDNLDPPVLYDILLENGRIEVVDNKAELLELQTEENKVHGCQSLVWINRYDTGEWIWYSNAVLVQGLLNVIMRHVQDMSDETILNLDLENDFAFICPTNITTGRVNGMKSVIKKLKNIVKER